MLIGSKVTAAGKMVSWTINDGTLSVLVRNLGQPTFFPDSFLMHLRLRVKVEVDFRIAAVARIEQRADKSRTQFSCKLESINYLGFLNPILVRP